MYDHTRNRRSGHYGSQSLMPEDAQEELRRSLDDMYAVCRAMDETSSDCHKLARDIEESGVVVDLVDPEDEHSVVAHIRRLEDSITEPF